MAEYIEREYLVKEADAVLEFRKSYYLDKERIKDAAATVDWLKYYVPAADVEPVRHGRWKHHENGIAYCSECEMDAVEDGTDYCPNCGAKMDATDMNVGEKEEE